jgi:hypothetical protein
MTIWYSIFSSTILVIYTILLQDGSDISREKGLEDDKEEVLVACSIPLPSDIDGDSIHIEASNAEPISSVSPRSLLYPPLC